MTFGDYTTHMLCILFFMLRPKLIYSTKATCQRFGISFE